MVNVKCANGDLVAASLRSIIFEVEALLKVIEENDVVMYQGFDTRLKKVILSINLLKVRFKKGGLHERKDYFFNNNNHSDR
ncbi:MAG: hypothetical protein Q8O30_07200 [Candidatus Omnitrophota bacterium]|nr:hypothetical protein [Candidatus Omnitrophota bacterium]